ncbi:MAG: STM4012 family radical SAM protein [Gordonia sp. (in: high G+C Gram-positive bacteria)]|uniref:STM4012 family radical SAM protein n=1 Tax=Gordonia sp. (in: high G+C Gram-positive bacteria) TaxID=84139 RepID=UPI0039E5984F
MTDLPATDLDASPYQGYLYAYPHKTAYRPLTPAPALREVWAGEDVASLFLYAHIPFCEMRCGFCNLFTRSRPPAEQVTAYLDALGRQASQVRDELAATGREPRFATAAIGGGTPTYLDAGELDRLFDVLTRFAPELPRLPIGVETSPATATADRLGVLADRGVHRVSMGIQSFLDAEARAAGRPQRRTEVDAALDLLGEGRFGVVNLDLIYGIDGQTPRTWRYSLGETIARAPEEIYLYPLYVRPLTGLRRRLDAAGHVDPEWGRHRLELYRIAVDELTAAGYRRLSMRQFRRADVVEPEGDYCCQEDGMVGLGCGARSYTSSLHYSFDYAVGVGAVREILEEYVDTADFRRAVHGTVLDSSEQRRRWCIKTLLRVDGIPRGDYRARFGTDVLDDLDSLTELVERGWAEVDDAAVRLTAAGLERSDVIGPWLVSDAVRARMDAAVAR